MARHVLPRLDRAAAALGDGETVHLHCTDTPRTRVASGSSRSRPTARRSTREHAKGDVAARGTASDLLLFLWGRVDPTQLEVFGDVARSSASATRHGVTVRGASARTVSRTTGPLASTTGAVVVTPFAA